MRLDHLTWSEVSTRAAYSVLAVPVGSTEQHGPHLPLSTDTAIAERLCTGLAAARSDVLVAPAVSYGSAGEHAGFPGTLSIGAAATEELLVELGRSADDFAGLVFVSAHGGNAGPVTAAARRLVAESRHVRAWSPPACGRGDDSHAGYTETSVLLALHPALVRTDRAAPGCPTPLADIMPLLRRSGVAAVSANGVLGDPAGATARAGREILDRWTESLLAAIAGWPES